MKNRVLGLLSLICVTFVAFGCFAPGVCAHTLSEFQNFRSFPYLDRAFAAEKRKDWGEVERLMTHLLGDVPSNIEARGTLINALTEQGKFEAARKAALGYEDDAQRDDAILDVQLRWIFRMPPSGETVLKWLEHTRSTDAHMAIWQAYMASMDVDRTDRTQSQLLRWLCLVAAKGDEIALRGARATLAERLDNWDMVIGELAPLAARDALRPDDWARLANAYINNLDEGGLHALLPSAPNEAAARDARLALIERAIGENSFDLAESWLKPLIDEGGSSQKQLEQLWQLARQRGNNELVYQTAQELGRPCVETAEWFVGRDNAIARDLLANCTADANPRSWLIVAQRIGAWDLLETVSLSGRWDARRAEILISHLMAVDHEDQALAWLSKRDRTPSSLRQMARVQQDLGLNVDAAKSWYELFIETGSAEALDQATYLDVQNGHPLSAMHRLEGAYQDAMDVFPHDLTERLARLYAENLEDDELPRMVSLLDRVDRDLHGELLLRLAYGGYCDIVHDNVGQDDATDASRYRALGQCALEKTPGTAVVYFRKAVEAGDTDGVLPLAYALDASGAYDAAMDIWDMQPLSELSPNAAMTAAHSALNNNQPDRAEEFWQSGTPETAGEWSLGASIALRQEAPDLALERQKQALSMRAGPEDYYSAAATAHAAGDDRQSTEWLQDAFDQDPDNARFGADLGMRLAGADDAERRLSAIPYIEQAIKNYPENYQLQETLANLYNQQGRSADAREHLRDAIDLEENTVVDRPGTESVESRQYRQRRAHEYLSRRDSVTLSSSWSPAGVSTRQIPGSDQVGRAAKSQNVQSLVWDHALGKEPSNAGESLSVYGRAMLGAEKRNQYGSNLGTGVGLRYKPFGDFNINLYGELYGQSRLSNNQALSATDLLNPAHLFDQVGDLAGDGDITGDVLLRATASFFDQGDYRNDWRVDEDSWNERSLYLDAAWWTHSDSYQWLSRYQQGRTFKLPTDSAQTLMPYGFAEMSAQRTDGDWREDTRTGVGLRWQLRWDDDTYNAYRKNVSVRVEYQNALGGNLYDKSDGVFVGMEFGF